MFNLNFYLFLLSIFVLGFKINDLSAETGQNKFLDFFEFHEPRIINGTKANLDASQHQVSIRKKRQDSYFFGGGHICGGSLISENVVLGAAHCIVNYNIQKPRGTFYPDDYFIAVMGDLDRYEFNNNTLVFDIVKILKRVDFMNLQTYENDIVLFMLKGKVPVWHPTVRPIVLNDGPLKNNTICQSTGWGTTEKGAESDVLLTVDLPIIDIEDCRNKTLYKSLIIDGMLCAGYLAGGKDTCQGDSGGPLVCGGIQAGIVSWGAKCAQALAPGVFTDVAFHKDWMLEAVGNNNGTLPKFASDSSSGGGESETGEDDGPSGVDGEDGHINGNGEGDGVAHLSCSLYLVNFMFILSFFLSQVK